MVCKITKVFLSVAIVLGFIGLSRFTYAEEIQRPVVIIPGMLASLNKKLMYEDKVGGKWGFVFGGNYYKDLINLLKEKGYEEGKTLFVAYYDWRKPVSETAQNYLAPKIKEAQEKSGMEQVDLVAHSMGGLLARSFIQSDEYDGEVLRLIMLGTPNLGAGSAYVAWEGGEYPSDWGYFVRKYVNSIETHLKKTHNQQDLTRPQSFRTYFRGLKDLLPIYSFTKKDGVWVAASDRAEQNLFLNSLDLNRDLMRERGVEVTTISGVEKNTLDKIYLTSPRSEDDISKLRWRDGKPIDENSYIDATRGDETVLFASASMEHFSPTMYKTENVAHVDLPNFAREKIYEIVSVPHYGEFVPAFFERVHRFFVRAFSSFVARADDAEAIDTPSSFTSYEEPTSVLSFTVSPNVAFEITDPDGKILSRTENQLGEDNANFDDDPADSEDVILVTIRNPKAGKYTLKIIGNTGGDYYVDSTFVNENGVFDDSNEGSIKGGEEKTLEATVSETTGVALPASETTEDETNDNNAENKSSSSAGANTSKNAQGAVLGATTVRLKLSQTIIWTQNKLNVLLHNKKPTEPKITSSIYRQLIQPLNELLTRAKLYETALSEKKTKQAGKLLTEMKGDYGDFVNKVDRLIAGGKLNQQTINVLTALKQRLARAGLR